MSASPSTKYSFEVTAEQAQQRLDRVLAGLELISSRSRGAELIQMGLVRIGGKSQRASYRVQVGDKIEIELPAVEPSALQPLDGPLEILFEDDDLVVINKPSGLVIHPAAGHAQDTLVNLLLHHIDHLSMGFAENRPGIVHRLDRDTSGVLVVAKNDLAHHSLAEQFRKKSVHRIYWAIGVGRGAMRERTIRSHLARHPQDRKRFASHSGEQGKLAITHVKILQSVAHDLHWVQCQLETGRTHQIRVHLSENGLPILGDPLYGRNVKLSQKVRAAIGGQTPRLCLHACELGFEHPRSHEKLFYHLPWPPDLMPLIKALEFKDV